MVLVHLVRHGHHAEVGQVLSGRSGIALDRRGSHEAAALVGAFDGAPIAAIYSSPRRRALETADPIAAARGLEVQAALALDEIDFGAFTGRRFDELDRDPDWHRWNSQRNTARCPAGETMAEAMSRSATFLLGLGAQGQAALCVSHCDIIRGLVTHFLGLPADHLFKLDCAPASITTLSIEAGAVRLVALNAPVPQRAGA